MWNRDRVCLFSGSGTPLQASLGQPRLVIAKGDMEIQDDPSEIGQQFFYGVGKRKSFSRAFPHLLQAAKLNDAHCQNLVGYSYHVGLGVEKDLAQAVAWYKRAARNDDKEALFNLALLYEKGEGVK